jgi:siroheme synthase (precorrin-2 oxidase/ferrochelatase)
MIKVTQVADDGTETATVEVDDFTLEVIYSGLAEMLRAAVMAPTPDSAASREISREARQRRQRVLTRIRD